MKDDAELAGLKIWWKKVCSFVPEMSEREEVEKKAQEKRETVHSNAN